jgi:hypothetical protein
MSKYIRLTVLVILFVTACAWAGEGDAGWAGAFYYVPIGARPAAMGGAYIGISDDGAGALYNPAGLSSIARPMFATSYRVMQLDRVLGYATVLVPTQGNSVLGAHWLYAGDKGLQARNRDGYELGWEIGKWDHDISVLFAKRFDDWLSGGAKINYLFSTFVDMTASTICFDVGLMFYLSELVDREKRDLMPVQDIQLGIVARHLGPKYRWNNDKYILKHTTVKTASTREDKIPVDVGIGGSARFFNRKLLAAVDLVKNSEQGLFFHGGLEYPVYQQLILRGGFSAGRLTAGTGYAFKLGKKSLAIDYAFSTDKADEGSEHIFSFDLLF